jgi:hypothetical protein
VKLHGFRRTQDGVVVSFVLHPAEVPQALALDPLGTRYMLALAAIGDDEEPIPQPGKEVVPDTGQHTVSEPRHDNATPPSSEAGVSAASQRGRERYAASTEMQQALIRAGRLPNKPQYQEWIGSQCGYDPGTVTAGLAITLLRRACKIGSRIRIAEDEEAYKAFLKHETAYLIATGQLAEPRR